MSWVPGCSKLVAQHHLVSTGGRLRRARCIAVPQHLNLPLLPGLPRVDLMALKPCPLPPQMLQIPQLLLMRQRSWRRS